MPDEASTPPADPPPQQATDRQSTQAPPSEPVSAPVSEPTPPPEAAAPAPEPEQTPTQTETPAQAEVSESVSEPTPAQQPTPQPQTTSSTPVPVLHGDIAKARAAIQDQKQKKLDKIMAKLSEKGKITNDEVEKLLRVSDATATRYLQALEKENKIKQTGSTGTGVLYEKI